MATPYRFGDYWRGDLLDDVSGDKWALQTGWVFGKGERGHKLVKSGALPTANGASIAFDWTQLHDKWVCFSLFADWMINSSSTAYYGILGNTAAVRTWLAYNITGTNAGKYSFLINATTIPISNVITRPSKHNLHSFFLYFNTSNLTLRVVIFENGTQISDYTSTAFGQNLSSVVQTLGFGYQSPIVGGYYSLRTFTDVLESEIPQLAAKEWKFAQGIRTNQKPVYLMYTQDQFNDLPSGTCVYHEDFENYFEGTGKMTLTGKELLINAGIYITKEERSVNKGIWQIAPLGVDTNMDGLSDGWSKTASATASIVTGNGFTGNAQRFEKTNEINAINLLTLLTNPYIFANGITCKIRFKYRSSVKLMSPGLSNTSAKVHDPNTNDAQFVEIIVSMFPNRMYFYLNEIGWAEIADLEIVKIIDIPKKYLISIYIYPIILKIPNPSGIFEITSQGNIYFVFNKKDGVAQYNITTINERITLYKLSAVLRQYVLQTDELYYTIKKIRILNNRVTGEIKVWVDDVLRMEVIDTTYNDATQISYYTQYSGKILDVKYSKL